ncbi:MAG: 30S ribosomal protein S18 [Candidatus Melainabacteria bacterium]|nr:30S ribosomal protein S18 [Candidatus Melainabacteria bacterium]
MTFHKRKPPSIFEGGVKEVDFQDVRTLARFITERGRILPRKITGLSAQQQKVITKAIKRARQMSLLPYISYGGS